MHFGQLKHLFCIQIVKIKISLMIDEWLMINPPCCNIYCTSSLRLSSGEVSESRIFLCPNLIGSHRPLQLLWMLLMVQMLSLLSAVVAVADTDLVVVVSEVVAVAATNRVFFWRCSNCCCCYKPCCCCGCCCCSCCWFCFSRTHLHSGSERFFRNSSNLKTDISCRLVSILWGLFNQNYANWKCN